MSTSHPAIGETTNLMCRIDTRIQAGQHIFGLYKVEKRLGRGGMGEVWLVERTDLKILRALKVIAPQFAFDDEARARFSREAQTMAQFRHPNAVTIYHAGLAEHDDAFIEMEYVAGQSLNNLLKKGESMPLDWVASVLEQLCAVLQAAHDAGIVHRDLKPSNLMLTECGELKVLDFGIAKFIGADGSGTMSNPLMGTPGYMSPEQAGGRADFRSDIYSVGVILYRLLTGFCPFSGTTSKLINDTQSTPPPSFAEVNSQAAVPAEVEAVVMHCLTKMPADRTQSARALWEEFGVAIRATAEAENDLEAKVAVAVGCVAEDIGDGKERRAGGLRGRNNVRSLVAASAFCLIGFWITIEFRVLIGTHQSNSADAPQVQAPTAPEVGGESVTEPSRPELAAGDWTRLRGNGSIVEIKLYKNLSDMEVDRLMEPGTRVRVQSIQPGSLHALIRTEDESEGFVRRDYLGEKEQR